MAPRHYRHPQLTPWPLPNPPALSRWGYPICKWRGLGMYMIWSWRRGRRLAAADLARIIRSHSQKAPLSIQLSCLPSMPNTKLSMCTRIPETVIVILNKVCPQKVKMRPKNASTLEMTQRNKNYSGGKQLEGPPSKIKTILQSWLLTRIDRLLGLFLLLTTFFLSEKRQLLRKRRCLADWAISILSPPMTAMPGRLQATA